MRSTQFEEDDMSEEMIEMFRAMKEAGRQNKAEARARRTTFLGELVDEGFKIHRFSDYQFRINGRIDIYPTNGKWHDVVTNKRGSFRGQNVAKFIREYFQKVQSGTASR